MPHFTLLDWFIVLLFLAVMVVVGYTASKSNKTPGDYALGGRSMNPMMIGISLFATMLSTLSYLAYPGEMIKYGPVYFANLLAFPIAYWIVSRWLIPRFMALKVTSAYEILEIKLGRGTRRLATLFFLSLRFMWMATITYATVDIAIIPILGMDPKWVPLIALILMLITVVYTTMGGMKAVVKTDVLQSVVMLLGIVLTIGVVLWRLGSFEVFHNPGLYSHWEPPRWGFDATRRLTVGNALLTVLIWQVCTAGSDQMAIQRYLSTRNVKAASRSYGISLIVNFIAQALLAVVGLVVMVYFATFPDQMAAGTTLFGDADTLFPRFILIGLPPGITGLIAAAIMAAAMSSVSSGLNSSAVVIQEDIIKKRRGYREKSPKRELHIVMLVTALLGITVAASCYLISFVPGNLLDVMMKVVNLVTAPLFVLFFLALFVPFATNRGAITGGLFALLAAILIAFVGIFGISVLWIMPIALATGIVSGMIFSYVETRCSRLKP